MELPLWPLFEDALAPLIGVLCNQGGLKFETTKISYNANAGNFYNCKKLYSTSPTNSWIRVIILRLAFSRMIGFVLLFETITLIIVF